MYPSSNDKDWKKESSDVTLIIARRSSKGIIFFPGCNSKKYLLSRRKQGRRIVAQFLPLRAPSHRLLLFYLRALERFSFECRKVIGFALSTRCDWLKRFAPPFHPIRSKTKANCDALARFSRALRQPHVITSSYDWFNVLSVSYVIGQSNYFGFGFTTLKRKPL